MSIAELSFNIIAVILLTLISIFFTLAETSILSLNKIRLKSHLEKKQENAIIIKELLNSPENFLAAILIGNNMVNIMISVLITVVVIQVFGPGAVTLATIVATFLILPFAEITPTAYATRNPEIAYKLARIMKFLVWILKPLIVFFTRFTNMLLRLLGVHSSIKEPIFLREDIRHLIEMCEENGVIQKEEERILSSALDFSQIRAKDVMIPIEKVTCIHGDATLHDALGIIHQKGFTRIPVIDGDKILGFVHIKDILNNLTDKEKTVREIARPGLFTTTNTSLLELVDLIKNRQSSMCFVLDEQGKTLGLVTLGLLLEKIVGEIK
ncbi:MAG TPA: hemolysin family protein, partial [Candidatus Methanoperedens sp.]